MLDIDFKYYNDHDVNTDLIDISCCVTHIILLLFSFFHISMLVMGNIYLQWRSCINRVSCQIFHFELHIKCRMRFTEAYLHVY